jgi:hypothetical protein
MSRKTVIKTEPSGRIVNIKNEEFMPMEGSF